jgi:hypothetical protein
MLLYSGTGAVGTGLPGIAIVKLHFPAFAILLFDPHTVAGCHRTPIYSQQFCPTPCQLNAAFAIDGLKDIKMPDHDFLLSWAAKLNLQAGCLATEYQSIGSLKLSPHVAHVAEDGNMDAQFCSISINGLRLMSQFDESIQYHVNGYHLRRYIQEENCWKDEV